MKNRIDPKILMIDWFFSCPIDPELGLVQIAHPVLVLVPEGAQHHVLVAAPVPTAPNRVTAPEVGPVRPVLLLCGLKKHHHVLNQHHRRPQHNAPHCPVPHLLTVVISLHCPVCWLRDSSVVNTARGWWSQQYCPIFRQFRSCKCRNSLSTCQEFHSTGSVASL